MSIFRHGRIDYCVYPNWWDKPLVLFKSWASKQICKIRPHKVIIKFTGCYCRNCGITMEDPRLL